MPKDKYTAVWLSHSTIGDYLKCPRSYYLKNIYKDPKTGHKIQVANSALSLGQAVHSAIDTLSVLSLADRQNPDLERLSGHFKRDLEKLSGKKGGFRTPDEQNHAMQRGLLMLERVSSNPGPLARPNVRIRMDLPYFWFSEDDNIILCGKIDWLEKSSENGVNIIDFKTGKYDEDPDSLQLPIYMLLATNTQPDKVTGAAYWYLERDNTPAPVNLPDADSAAKTLTPIAKKIALARKLNHFSCPQTGGCRACLPLEAVLAGKGELVDFRENRDIYYLP